MTNKRLRLLIAAAAVVAFSGLGVNVKNTKLEMMSAVAQSCDNGIRNENFSLVVASTNGIILRSERRLAAHTNATVAFNQTVDFDAWAYGEEITDLWNERDALWFKLRGRNLWVPSGYMKGFPPSKPSRKPNCPTNNPPGNPPNFRSVSFSGKAAPGGVNIRSGTSTNAPVIRRSASDEVLSFDGWTYGDTVPDFWTNQPDARWYRIAGRNEWVASAVVNGNAPDSKPLPGGGGIVNPPPGNGDRSYLPVPAGTEITVSQGYHGGLPVNQYGVDMVSNNRSVVAPRKGTIVQAGYDRFCGNFITIRYDAANAYGGTHGLFCHLASRTVSSGRVSGGQQIGIYGWTGTVIPAGPGGAHIHYAELKGEYRSGNVQSVRLDFAEVNESRWNSRGFRVTSKNTAGRN